MPPSRRLPNSELTTDQQPLGARLRTECLRRGWSLSELALRTGVSRTTLSQLAGGRTGRPHNDTLLKIAAALGVPVESLLKAEWPEAADVAPVRPDLGMRAFDAATNPAVAAALRERPELFAGWSVEELDELQSLVGAGGALTPRGVELAAEAINRRRETIHKLQIVLETHLCEDATKMVDMFYRMVQPPQMRAPESRSGAL